VPTPSNRPGTRRGWASQRHSRTLDALLQATQQAALVLDAEARVTAWNDAATALLGYSRDEMVGERLPGRVLAGGSQEFEEAWRDLASGLPTPPFLVAGRSAEGKELWLTVRLAPVGDERELRAVVVVLAEGPAAPLPAPELSITKAPNGPHSRADLARRLSSPVPAGLTRAVALMKVDDLSAVPSQVPEQLAMRWARVTRGAVLGQWEPGEFLLLIDAVDASAQMWRLMRLLHLVAREPLTVGDQVVRVTISAGLARGSGDEAGRLLGAATDALRMASLSGGDQSVWFDASSEPASEADVHVGAALREGLEQGEMRLHYQPIIDVARNVIWGAEALVRWDRPGVGLVPPAGFIELAERTGQIVPLGAWVTNEACATAADLDAPSGQSMHVSINLSGRQLMDPGVLPMLRSALELSGCAPGLIEIEVTETALMRDLNAAREALHEVKALGVGLSLDDFGTGYSSLAYLKHFPVDRIKIDRSFVAGVGQDPDDTAIVASTIALAHIMGIRCVAEGVETGDQYALLRRMGCDFAQGYFIARPMPIEALRSWVPPLPPPRD
jgi:PAS domain S-box-containing protein